MNMPRVMSCDVGECAYNQENTCHAMAITVGDTITPHCDTFCGLNSRGGEPDVVAGVGACKVAGCTHNQHLECHAPSVTVGHNGDGVECLTFHAA